MSERLLPSDDPVAEQVLEWTIQRDSADIRQLMQWVERSDGRKGEIDSAWLVLLNLWKRFATL